MMKGLGAKVLEVPELPAELTTTPPLDWKYCAAELTVELPVTSKLMLATLAPRSAAQFNPEARVE